MKLTLTPQGLVGPGQLPRPYSPLSPEKGGDHDDGTDRTERGCKWCVRLRVIQASVGPKWALTHMMGTGGDEPQMGKMRPSPTP